MNPTVCGQRSELHSASRDGMQYYKLIKGEGPLPSHPRWLIDGITLAGGVCGVQMQCTNSYKMPPGQALHETTNEHTLQGTD